MCGAFFFIFLNVCTADVAIQVCCSSYTPGCITLNRSDLIVVHKICSRLFMINFTGKCDTSLGVFLICNFLHGDRAAKHSEL